MINQIKILSEPSIQNPYVIVYKPKGIPSAPLSFDDKNNLQIDGSTQDVKCIDPLDKKLEAFGFDVINVDGHNTEELEKALDEAKKPDKLVAIIANTTKGKGVSFMENNAGWHGKAPNDEDLARALEELNA